MFLGKGLLLPSLTGERWARIAPNTAKECPRSRAHLETVRQALERRVYKHLDVFWRAVWMMYLFYREVPPSFTQTWPQCLKPLQHFSAVDVTERVRAGRRRASAHARGVGGCLQSVLIPWYVWLGVMIRLMYTAIVRKVRSFLLTEIFWYEKVK